MSYLPLFLVFAFVMGVSVLNNWQTQYPKKPILLSLYFFVASVVVVYVFPIISSYLLAVGTVYLVIGAYIFAFLIYATIRRLYPSPSAFLEKYGRKNIFIQLQYSFLIPKGFEIAFQQLCCASFVLLLVADGFSFGIITALSVLVVALAHLPLTFTHGLHWGSFYASGAVVLGLLIPYLVLFVPGGLALSFGIHFLAYVFAGALVWVRFGKRA